MAEMGTLERWRFEAIGTAWTISTPAALAGPVREAVRGRICAYDAVWSRFREDSVVSRLARTGGSADLGPEAADLLSLYDDLAAATGGAVNPLIGDSLVRLGYDAQYSFRVRGLGQAAPPWSSARWDPPVLTLDEPALIDVGAAAKGQLVDLVTGVLREHGVTEAIVDAGGDVRNDGPTPVRVALEHPREPAKAIGVVTLEPGRAICASAINRRVWGDGVHHVVDARLGQPTSEVLATWCTAPTAMLADGVATALFFSDTASLAERFDVACARVDATGRITHSANLVVEWFR